MKPNLEITLRAQQPSNNREIHSKHPLLLMLTVLIALLICVDSASADDGAFYMKKWGSQGTANGQFDNPYAVAIDSAGNVYVADTHNSRIQKFSTRPGLSLSSP